MIIKNLSVANFRKYIRLNLDFPAGVIGVIGKNGSGKSTLLEILAWAMYGHIGLKTTIGQLFPDFLGPKGETKAKISFETNRSNYQIERSFKHPNKSNAILYADDKVLATGTREVSLAIEKLTGMDFKAFQTSFYTRQNELNFLGNLQAAERSRRLEEMLGLEKTNSIINNIKGDIRSLEGEKKGHEQLLEQEEDYKNALAEKTTGLETALLSNRGLEEEFAGLKIDLDRLRSGFDALEARRETFKKLDGRLALKRQKCGINADRIIALEDEMAAIDSQKSRLKELENEVAQLTGLRQRLSELDSKRIDYEAVKHKRKQLDELADLIAQQKSKGLALKERLQSLKDDSCDIDIINNNIKELSALADSLRKTTTDLKVEQASAKSQLRKLNNQLKDIEMLGPEAVCSFCLRPFRGEMDQIAAHFESEIEKLNKLEKDFHIQLQNQSARLEQVLREKQEKEEHREKLEEIIRKLEKVRGEAIGLAADYKSNLQRKELLEKELERYGQIEFDPGEYQNLKTRAELMQKKEGELARLSERMAAREKLSYELAKLKQELAIINDNIKALRLEIEELQYSEDDFLRRKEELKTTSETLRIKEMGLAEGRKREAVLKSEIEGLKNQLEMVAGARKRIHELVSEKIYLESLAEIVRELKIELASRIRPILINYSSDLLERMSDGKFSELDLNENYDISIRDYGELWELGRFSGGEQDLANLSLRLAISKLLATSSNLEAGFLILDEVFGSQDNFRKENILGAIAGLQDFFQQIFIVTHVEDIKEAVQTLITIEENRDGSSLAIIE